MRLTVVEIRGVSGQLEARQFQLRMSGDMHSSELGLVAGVRRQTTDDRSAWFEDLERFTSGRSRRREQSLQDLPF